MIKLFSFNGTDGVIVLEGNTTCTAEVGVPVTLKKFSDRPSSAFQVICFCIFTVTCSHTKGAE